MIEDRIVKPRRNFALGFSWRHHHGVSIRSVSQFGEIRQRLNAISFKSSIDSRSILGAPLIRKIGPVTIRTAAIWAFTIADDVGCMVGNDVHIDFHATPMSGGDEGLEVCIGAEMRVNLGEVRDPIAVISRCLLTGRALHRLVLKDGCKPNRCCPKTLDIVQPIDQALEIATVIEGLLGWIKACLKAIPCKATSVITRVASFEPVGQQKINNLIFRQALAKAVGLGGGHRHYQISQPGQG